MVPETRLHTGAVDALSAALDGLALTPHQRFRAAVALLYREGAALDVPPEKLHNGGINEVLVAAHCGHTVAPGGQGEDARTADGVPIEQKNSHLTAAKTRRGRRAVARCNFNYRQPTRRSGESAAAYLRRVRAHWLAKASGGHVLSVLDGAAVVHAYHLDGAFMAAYMVEWTRRRIAARPYADHKLNLGCARCRDCGAFHRVAALKDAGKRYTAAEAWTAAQWTALLDGRVAAHCGKEAET